MYYLLGNNYNLSIICNMGSFRGRFMNKNIRKIITSTVLATMTISVLPSNLVVFATDGITENFYEIYPKPQEISYSGGEFQISDEINIVYDDGIDTYTKKAG